MKLSVDKLYEQPEGTRFVLGLSGGKDSSALAVFMSQEHPDLDIEYFFSDTGKELPEVYEYLQKLEVVLGKNIVHLNADRDFDYWLKIRYGHFLPSPQTRWCTRQLKIKPFEEWIQPTLEEGNKVVTLVAIRADETYREGYISTNDLIVPCLPFIDKGIDKEGVFSILEDYGLGLPEYYKWRSRSGCTFCFYQQKIEWVHLMEKHPEAFAEAIEYEKDAIENGSPFTWSERESLIELSKPERVEQIKADFEKRKARVVQRPGNALRPDSDEGVSIEEVYGSSKICFSCHK